MHDTADEKAAERIREMMESCVKDRDQKPRPQRWPKDYVEERGKTFFLKFQGKDEPPRKEYVCDAFRVVAQSFDEHGCEWSILLQFASVTGKQQTVQIGMRRLQAEPHKVREEMVARGLRIEASSTAKARFDTLLSLLETSDTIMSASNAGFHLYGGGPVFVGPTGVALDASGARTDVRLQQHQLVRDPVPRGDLAGWLSVIEAVLESGNHHWIIGTLSGLGGLLLQLLEMDTCGINLSGPSSFGKSTAQRLGAAVWANPKSGAGLMHALRSTPNAIENLAARSNGTTLQLDELGNMDPKQLGAFIYGIAGGVGKQRQRSDSSLRESMSWCTFLVLSSERGMADIMQAAQQRLMTGHAVRIADVNMTDMRSLPPEHMQLIEGYKRHYGHSGPLLVEYLFTKGFVDDPDDLRDMLTGYIAKLVGSVVDGPIRRAAIPFAILWLAGQLAVEAGALPAFDPEASIQWAWHSYRSGAEAEALEPMTRALNSTRTTLLTGWGIDVVQVPLKAARDDPERFQRPKWGWFDDDVIYVHRDQLGALAGNFDKPQAIAKHLDEKGLLRRGRGSDKLHERHLPGIGRLDHYRIDRHLLLETEPR